MATKKTKGAKMKYSYEEAEAKYKNIDTGDYIGKQEVLHCNHQVEYSDFYIKDHTEDVFDLVPKNGIITYRKEK